MNKKKFIVAGAVALGLLATAIAVMATKDPLKQIQKMRKRVRGRRIS